MRTLMIGKDASGSPACFSRLSEVTLNSVREALPDRAVDQACRQAGYAYRKRVLTPVVTVLHMILSALWPEESFRAGMHLIWSNFVGIFPHLGGHEPTTSGATSKARARLPLEVWRRILDDLSGRAQQLSEPLASWRGHRVVLVDGTCVSMPNLPELHEHFGTATGRGRPRIYPLARMVTLSLAHTMVVIAYALGHYRDSEQKLLRSIRDRLRPGDLLVADRHFAGANLYAEYQAAGLNFLTRAHQALKISRLKPLVGYGPDDFVTDLKVGDRYRREDPNLPAKIRVRLIQASVVTRSRREVMWFVTSLWDVEAYPAAELVELYARRWRIETLFLHLKRRLSADVLRSKSVEGVGKELASCVAALNVVRTLMLQAALACGQDPMRLSFVGALRTILSFAPLIAAAAPWKLPEMRRAMLTQIALQIAPYRPGRQEPRAVRREWKHYPKLKSTRQQWRNLWAA